MTCFDSVSIGFPQRFPNMVLRSEHVLCPIVKPFAEHWAYANKVTLAFSRPGKPTDNADIESFNGRLREECLNVHRFEDLTDARAKIQVGNRRTIRSGLMIPWGAHQPSA